MAKTDRNKDRGTILVEDEPDLLRHEPAARSRVEKEFLPDAFERFPVKRRAEAEKDLPIRRRVPVKKSRLPEWTKTRWGRVFSLLIVIVVIGGGLWAVLAARSFLLHDSRFRIESSDAVQTMGNSQLTRDDLLSVFGSDIGRNIFYVPLAERRAELEQIPWVAHATVMRILPDELRVAIKERTPVAFVRVGDAVRLVDAAGVILDMPPAMMAARHYSFPVVTGINPSDPLTQRAARMRVYESFIQALDSSGQHLSGHVSEVDMSDPYDVLATVPVNSSDLLLHFGNKDFLARYQLFQSHVSEWEQQYPQLAGVDLRYQGEVVLKMSKPTATSSPEAAGDNAKIANPASPKEAKPERPQTARRHRRNARR